MLKAMQKLTYEQSEHIAEGFVHVTAAVYDMDHMEKTYRKAFEFVKNHAIKTLQLNLEKFDQQYDQNRSRLFSGTYSEEVLQSTIIIP